MIGFPVACMPTTIQVKEDVKATLDRMKIFRRETYNDVLERLIEDLKELNDETRKEIDTALKQVKEGKYVTHEALKKEMGF
jgi:predicted transcriptional regulator